ncbi:MAG: MBL fold metallo-hydrolase [Saprospiraceae bacterium]|nr:MBL fold metallo-hydrolase [Saprospiraceae bacterium]
MQVQGFTFNPFAENTYVLHDESGECAIVDPGCYDRQEQDKLVNFIETKSLKPVLLLNTHCHLDHIFANAYISEKYDLPIHGHREEVPVLNASPKMANLYGLQLTPSPEIKHFLDQGDNVSFGNTTLEVRFTPGHSPGSICFLDKTGKKVISGDVLFMDSIGRTDLPGGDHQTLLNSIEKQLLPLDDEWEVYSGHGPKTTIGRERRYNPFLKAMV